MVETFPIDKLPGTGLTVEVVYESDTAGNTVDNPLGKLVPVGNRLVVLCTTGAGRDWPDALDRGRRAVSRPTYIHELACFAASYTLCY